MRRSEKFIGGFAGQDGREKPPASSSSSFKGEVPSGIDRADYLKAYETVSAIARKIHRRLPPWVRFEDIEGAGMVGLTEAAGKFDPIKGVSFLTFAYERIEGSIMDEVRRIYRHRDEVSYEQLEGEGDIAGVVVADQEKVAILAQDADLVIEALSTMDERTRNIYEAAFVRGDTHQKIADDFGISRARVGQLISRAVEKIRKHAKGKRMEEDGKQTVMEDLTKTQAENPVRLEDENRIVLNREQEFELKKEFTSEISLLIDEMNQVRKVKIRTMGDFLKLSSKERRTFNFSIDTKEEIKKWFGDRKIKFIF